MHTSRGEFARKNDISISLSSLICTIIVSVITVPSSAQIVSCPAAPTVQANGAVEGRVTGIDPGSGNPEEGLSVSVGIDGLNRFAVAWETTGTGGVAADTGRFGVGGGEGEEVADLRFVIRERVF